MLLHPQLLLQQAEQAQKWEDQKDHQKHQLVDSRSEMEGLRLLTLLRWKKPPQKVQHQVEMKNSQDCSQSIPRNQNQRLFVQVGQLH